jgi:hypothetical protein
MDIHNAGKRNYAAEHLHSMRVHSLLILVFERRYLEVFEGKNQSKGKVGKDIKGR